MASLADNFLGRPAPRAKCRVCGVITFYLNEHGDCRACVEASLDRAFGWNFWTWRRG